MEGKYREFAFKAAEYVDSKKGLDIKILEVGELTLLADYFLICSGSSSMHIQSICDYLQDELEEEEFPLLRVEGYNEGRWILLDYGTLIVHIFLSDERVFYNLERLWGKAPVVALSANP